jgi:hypothetical protein
MEMLILFYLFLPKVTLALGFPKELDDVLEYDLVADVLVFACAFFLRQSFDIHIAIDLV